jgi:hypothetical protein
VIVTLLLPMIGVFTYLITQGQSMTERTEREVWEQRAATEAYIRSVAGDADAVQMAAVQMATARDLLESGAITTDEFDRMVQRAHS